MPLLRAARRSGWLDQPGGSRRYLARYEARLEALERLGTVLARRGELARLRKVIGLIRDTQDFDSGHAEARPLLVLVLARAIAAMPSSWTKVDVLVDAAKRAHRAGNQANAQDSVRHALQAALAEPADRNRLLIRIANRSLAARSPVDARTGEVLRAFSGQLKGAAAKPRAAEVPK